MIVWHNVPIDMPKYGEEVLAIKETKSGVRSFCFATLFPADKYGPEHWVTGGGCTNVIYWTPLPKMPEKRGEQDE